MAEILRVDDNFNHEYFVGSSCAFGVFDGVHRGHQFLLACARNSAQSTGGKSIALTFDIDPDEKFHPDRLQKLMTNEDRIACLASTGVDAVAVLPFTDGFAAYGPAEFLERTFNGYAPESLHIGSDFRFGARARGTVKELEEWGSALGTSIVAHDLESSDGLPITSTRIRLLLGEGEMEKANELLGRPYYLRGKVHAGRGEGVDFGFRTANLHFDPQIQTLGDGVYAAYVTVGEDRYKAAVSVGVSPMFEGQTTATCEAHILDYSGNLYGKSIKVEFVHYLRAMIDFETQDQLIETVMGNIAWVGDHL